MRCMMKYFLSLCIFTTIIVLVMKINKYYGPPDQQVNSFTGAPSSQPPSSPQLQISLALINKSSSCFSVPPSTTNSNEFPIPSIIYSVDHGTGIGNQLFKYAAAYSFSQQLNAQLYLHYDVSRIKGRDFDPAERSFALDQFTLDTTKYKQLSSWSQLPRHNKSLLVHINEVTYFTNKIPKDKIILLDDYWVSEIFFQRYKAEILSQYELVQDVQDLALQKHQSMYSLIESAAYGSVAVHFRHGDFNGAASLGNDREIPFEYQLRAMELMTSKLQKSNTSLTFFIFSDSIDIVKQQLQLKLSKLPESNRGPKLIFVSNQKTTSSIEEFDLMKACKHMIVANSTFSWWAAYLNKNPNKIIIAPFPAHKPSFYERYKSWGKDVKKYKDFVAAKYLYPKGWITINPFIQ